jgi:integrase
MTARCLGELTEKKKKGLLDSALGLDRLVILLLLDTGVEVKDLIGIRTSDVDFERGILRVSGRSITLSKGSLDYLKSYVEGRPGQAYLLEGRCGKPITCKWRRCVLDSLMQRI